VKKDLAKQDLMKMDVAERRFLMAGPGPAGLAAAGRRLFWAGQLPAAERCGPQALLCCPQ